MELRSRSDSFIRAMIASIAGRGHGRQMCKQRVLTICAAIITASIATDTSAQYCDERYAWTCQRYEAQPYETIRPEPPLRPREFDPQPAPLAAPVRPRQIAPTVDPAVRGQHAALYARVGGEPFPIPAVRLSDIDPEYLRRPVHYPTSEPPGTIVVDAKNRFLYLVQGAGRALRYGVGVGRQGFGWSGVATIHDKQEWPDWYPPKEMIARQPELRRQVVDLQGGLGVPGGPRNPLGARALYLWQGNKDTLYRIHGTFEPWTIGTSVSSGCIRMINQDVIDLYGRAALGARVVVLPSRS
jgi:lipoprotein-anchoring transpeptidase ErfK/SrfK